MSEKSSGVQPVRKEIAIVAGPRGWGDTRESWLGRVHGRVNRMMKAKITARTVKALWYGEITDEGHWAARDIRKAAAIIEGRREAAGLANQFDQIIGEMRDQDLDSPEVAALLGAVRALRNVARS